MKRLPYTTGLISVLAAVALWFVANLFEDDSRWTGLVEKESPEINSQQRRPDTSVRPNTSQANCVQAEDAMRRAVSDAQYCSNDDECTLFDYGYPIQCMTSVAKSRITTLRLEYRNYEQSCAYRVYYDCPSGDSQRAAVCRNNRCEVEILSMDQLQDDTLKYLRIE
jgi:hypothetical protein